MEVNHESTFSRHSSHPICASFSYFSLIGPPTKILLSLTKKTNVLFTKIVSHVHVPLLTYLRWALCALFLNFLSAFSSWH